VECLLAGLSQQPAGLQKSATAVTCGDRGSHRWEMIARRVPTPDLPDLHPASQLAVAPCSFIGSQGRGVARLAPRGRRASQNDPETAAGLGRPDNPVRTHPTAAPDTPPPPPGYTKHHLALAPSPGCQKVDLSAPIRAPAHQRHRRHTNRENGLRRTQTGVTRESKENSSNLATASALRRSAGSSLSDTYRQHHPDTPTQHGGSSYAHRPPPCWPWTSSMWTAL